MTCFDVLFIAAAATALCRGWFLGSGWIAVCREYAEAWRAFPSGWRRQLGALACCPVCLSMQFCLWITFLFYLPSVLLPEPFSAAVKLPIYALAAAALVPTSYAKGGPLRW